MTKLFLTGVFPSSRNGFRHSPCQHLSQGFRTLLLSSTPFGASEALVSVLQRNMSEQLQQDTVKRSVQQIECPGEIGDFLDRRDSRLNSPDHNCWTEYQQILSRVRQRNVEASC